MNDFSGIYLHIPFCRRRCNYCDFYIVTRLDLMQRYIAALLKEIKTSSEFYKDKIFDSVYIGGGTPSLLGADLIKDILNYISENYHLTDNPEITFEVNPEDIKDIYILEEYKKIGINRISFGLQSTNKKELIFLTRYSDLSDILEKLKLTLKIFENTSVDIIYSLPEFPIKFLNKTLDLLIELKVPHISAYTLIFEENTILNYCFLNKIVLKNNDDIESEQYDLLSNKLKNAGYDHYEISSYAIAGYYSIHNKKYWDYTDYLGFGASAHSFVYPKRWNNFSNIIKYYLSLENNILPFEKINTLEKSEIESEFIYLGLRSKGVELSKFSKITGTNFLKRYENSVNILIKNGYAHINEKYFKLNYQGFKIADEIISKYF